MNDLHKPTCHVLTVGGSCDCADIATFLRAEDECSSWTGEDGLMQRGAREIDTLRATIAQRDAELLTAATIRHGHVEEIERLRKDAVESLARVEAAKLRLGDLKALHSNYIDRFDKRPVEQIISEMEGIAYSVRMYLDGVSGLYRVVAREAVAVDQPDGRDKEIERLRRSLREAWHIARDGCLVEPDGGSPSEDEVRICDRIADRIQALIDRVGSAADQPDGRGY